MCMIFINDVKLPHSQASYLAFRIAFQETLERISLARQFRDCSQDGFGYLTEVPFLSNVAPMVQLELLADTWHRHISEDCFPGTLLDEAVIYAVCERSAWSMENESLAVIQRYLNRGPWGELLIPARSWSHQLRKLHADVSVDADFLMISQFEDIFSDEATALKQDWGIDPARLEPLFECQQRWYPSPNMRDHLNGLLSPSEIDFVTEMFRLPIAAK